jgi:hypothetical protein
VPAIADAQPNSLLKSCDRAGLDSMWWRQAAWHCGGACVGGVDGDVLSEHQTTNLGVGGSNPSGRASNFNELDRHRHLVLCRTTLRHKPQRINELRRVTARPCNMVATSPYSDNRGDYTSGMEFASRGISGIFIDSCRQIVFNCCTPSIGVGDPK